MPSTWSIWTGAAVWVAGMGLSGSTSPADGVPGLRSTKKLPSRKMRGRIFSSAFWWIGSASSSSFMVTTVVVASSESASTFDTSPTCTPAIRTGERS